MILVYLALLALLVGFILLLAPLLIEQAKGIIAKLPAYYQGLHAALGTAHRARSIQRLAQQLPAQLTLSLPRTSRRRVSARAPWGKPWATSA